MSTKPFIRFRPTLNPLNNLVYIALQGIRLYGYHGVHAAERQWGTWFELDVQVGISRQRITTLQDTVNYETILQICQEEFTPPVDLLEDILWRIEQRVLNLVPDALKLQVVIRKQNPPLAGSVQASQVRIDKTYSPDISA